MLGSWAPEVGISFVVISRFIIINSCMVEVIVDIGDIITVVDEEKIIGDGVNAKIRKYILHPVHGLCTRTCVMEGFQSVRWSHHLKMI